MTTEDNPEEEIETVQPEEEAPVSDEQEGEEEGAESKPEAQLQALIEAAKSARPSPADEERAIQVLKEGVLGGPKALPVTLDAILTLPWSVGVKAVTEAWPEAKAAGRARLIAGLAKIDTDASRRSRLSLARGLHGQDPDSALKLVASVCESMGGAQGGSTTKDRQIFASVMLGKARPWLMNIPMAEMKPADAQKIITPALESCQQAPIFTQIWVLRWICDADKFETLPPEHIESIGKSINRWQPRWRKELRKIIPKLPEALEAVLADSQSRQPAQIAPQSGPEGATGAEDTGEEEAATPGAESGEESASEPQAGEPRHQPSHRGQEQRSSRERQHPFDLTRSLRDIEGYVARLRTELQQAQSAARRREPGPERQQRGRAQQAAGSPEDIDELRRHNQQLEEQNQDLRHRIEELASDHEDRAATIEIADSLEQFKTFLGLKLKEDFADYTAISRESLNEVVRRHAHEILGRVFSVLQGEGVRFDHED